MRQESREKILALTLPKLSNLTHSPRTYEILRHTNRPRERFEASASPMGENPSGRDSLRAATAQPMARDWRSKSPAL